MKFKGFIIFSVVLFGFTVAGDGLIASVYPSLIGKYQFVKAVSDKRTEWAKEKQSVYTVEITKKDQIMYVENGKRVDRLKFVDTKMPFLDDQNHLFFGKNNEFEPLFYRGDTIVIQSFPNAFQENYFLKTP